ncbi:MAG TPA: ATPase [Steroidobacter sp.]|uniref:ATPase n=1 Tax=Steroidobacter sp. TaxID=1978227 RepID=UPI002ED8C395
MSDKPDVSVEQGVCIVCGHPYDTGTILLHVPILRKSMERQAITAWGLCPQHLMLYRQGYVALVECDTESGNPDTGAAVRPENVHSTEPVAYLKRERASAIFHKPVAPNQPCMCVAPGFVQKLQQITQHA